MDKKALIERLVRLGATDVPGTPRLLMKQRSPQELAALQHGVSDTFRRFEDPAKKAIHGVLDKVTHEKTRNVLKSGANTLIENPEMLPITALPIPGVSMAYLAGKKGLEKGLDRLSPLPKLAAKKETPLNERIGEGVTGAGLLALSPKTLQMAGHRAIGAQPIMHGTSEVAASRIREEGLDPAKWGREAKSMGPNHPHTELFAQGAKDHAFVTELPSKAKRYAAAASLSHGAPPTVLSGAMPFEDFAQKFVPDDHDNPFFSFKTKERIPPSVFETSVGDIAKHRLKNPKGYFNYLKTHPGRIAQAVGLAAVPIAGGALVHHAFTGGSKEKNAFSTNAFSGPMNPVIASGASYQPGFKMPGLRAPVQQKTAEEFKLQGHTTHQGLDIAIENRKGSVRKGVDKDGKPWRTKMIHPYGYIKGTKGADGEEVDAYVGPCKDATHAHVVHQKKEDGSYDEDKVMLGFASEEDAKAGYLAHYNTDKFLGPIKKVPMERLRELIAKRLKLVKIAVSKEWISKMVEGAKASPGALDSFALQMSHNARFLPSGEARSILPWKKSPVVPKLRHAARAAFDTADDKTMAMSLPAKIAASSPTRGGFMLASDIPAFKSPSLRAPIEKNSDMLPDYVPSDEGAGFKRSKYASALEKLKIAGKVRVFTGDPLLDKKKEDPVDRGEIVAEDGETVEKQADISPTQPLGNGGGNPHRMQSWLASPQVNSLAAPLNKVAEPMGDFAAAYWGGPGAAGRGPVSEAGFRQASDQNGPPTNSLRAPLRKLGSLVPGSASAAKNVGTKPMFGGGPGQSIADIAKPKGMKFGGPLPGANKTTIGGYVPPSLK